MFKSTRYSKVDRFCEVCDCLPCDCHGVEDELRIMGAVRTHEAREEPLLALWQDRLASFSLVQMESGLIEPKNRILLSSLQGDLPAEEGTNRENDKRGSSSDGDLSSNEHPGYYKEPKEIKEPGFSESARLLLSYSSAGGLAARSQ